MSTRASMGLVWLATQMPAFGLFCSLWYVTTGDSALDNTLKQWISTRSTNLGFHRSSGQQPTTAVHSVKYSTCNKEMAK